MSKIILSIILTLSIMVGLLSLLPTNAVSASNIPSDALEYNGHYYKVYSNVSNSWDEAKQYCESLGGHLATISSSSENNAIYSYIISCGYKNAYFGFTDSETEGVWKWVNEESVSYTNWHSGEPNAERSNEDYAMFYWKFSDGSWNDGNYGQGTVSDQRVFICEWDGDIADQYSKMVDDYLIEQVKKYTSESPIGTTQYNAIMNSNYSDDIKFKMLNELFKNYGFTDAKEGILYLMDNNTYRKDYQFLTTNELYCAYDFYNWLNNTASGKATRGLLWADGFLLNSEMTSYFDVTTYTDIDFPGVKKNKELLREFLDQKMPEAQALSCAKKVASNLKNTMKLNITVVNDQLRQIEDKLDEITDSVLSSKSEAEIKRYQKQFAEQLIKGIKLEGQDSAHIKAEKFTKALGYGSEIISFANATANDVYALLCLNQDIEKYTYYSKFLTTIVNCDYASDDMRLAAYCLLDDINNGYFNRIVGIFGDIFTFDMGIVKLKDVNLWKEVFGEGGAAVGDFLSTLSLGAFIANFFIDTGDFVKKAAYVQGYAELSIIYSNILHADKKAFVNNPSAENAWKFFEDYSVLWSLRYKGEESYLKLCEFKVLWVGRVKSPDFALKSAVVNDNLNLLNQKKFDLAGGFVLPSSVQYFSKAVINCPVDVYVYNDQGELIAELLDGVESDLENEYGRFAVMKQSYSGEYAKIVASYSPVSIKTVAHTQGLVDYQCASLIDNNIYVMNNVIVDKGTIICTNNEDISFTIDYDGDGETELSSELIPINENYVPIEMISSSVAEIEMIINESQLVDVSVSPINATYQDIDMYTDNEKVVNIQNGVVTAVGAGTANVYIKALNEEDKKITIPVTVSTVLGDVDGSGVIDASDPAFLLRTLVHYDVPASVQENMMNGDVDGNGKLEAPDATFIQRYLVHYDTPYSIGEAIE